MSTIEINGEWYVLVAPNDDNYVIADVKDSVGTEFLEAENNKMKDMLWIHGTQTERLLGFL